MKMQVEIEGDTAHIRGKSGPATSQSQPRGASKQSIPCPIAAAAPALYGYSPAEIYYDNLKVW